MSSNLPYKQAANVERRTWDKKAYEERAKARLAAEENGESTSNRKIPKESSIFKTEVEKEEFQKADEGAMGPLNSKRAFLKARTQKVDLESKVGKTEIIDPSSAAISSSVDVSISDGVTKSVTGVGWHCKVCDCFLKDSLTYLDHINGKKHQRALGYSMRTAKSTTSEVVNKLDELAKRQKMNSIGESMKLDANVAKEEDEINFFDEIVAKKDQDLAKRKEERKKRRKEKKKHESVEKIRDNKEFEEEVEEEVKEKEVEEKELTSQEEEGTVNPDLAALMGFSSFS